MNEWIKVSDKLPAIEEEVLIYEKNDKAIFIGALDKTKKFYHLASCVVEVICISHWMPLPEAPKD